MHSLHAAINDPLPLYLQARNSISGAVTGKYDIRNVCSEEQPPKQLARCDMQTDGGGWLVIQRRTNFGVRVDFDKTIKEYVDGFGDLQNLQGEFWYGLKNIHCLTRREVELRIDLRNEFGHEFYWNYQTFRVSGPEDHYRLEIGGATGTPGTSDSMMHSNGQYFTTIDSDNDHWRYNCAWWCKGGWWYNKCTYANLNGVHDRNAFYGIFWYNAITHNFDYITDVEMKIRPKSCPTPRP